MDTLLWYWAVSWDYVAQMLPCMLLAALVFFLLRPWRKKRLARQGMASGGLREAALLFFVMFCAGLAALTVFPLTSGRRTTGRKRWPGMRYFFR